MSFRLHVKRVDVWIQPICLLAQASHFIFRHKCNIDRIKVLTCPEVNKYISPKCQTSLHWHVLNSLSLQVQHSVPTWQEASAHQWLFSATNYLMSSVSGAKGRWEKVSEKWTKQIIYSSHSALYTSFAQPVEQSCFCGGLTVSSYNDEHCRNHRLLKNSSLSHFNWNFNLSLTTLCPLELVKNPVVSIIITLLFTPEKMYFFPD